MTNKPKVVGIYVRVSTENQKFDSQIKELEKYRLQRGYKIYRTYSEKVSGKKSDRELFGQMMKDAKQGKFDVLLVWDLSRLGRNTVDVVTCINELSDIGVGVEIYNNPGINTTGASGKLMVQIISAFAEFEREMAVARVKSGVKACIENRGGEVSMGKFKSKGAWGRSPICVADYTKMWELRDKTNYAIHKETGLSQTTIARYRPSFNDCTPEDYREFYEHRLSLKRGKSQSSSEKRNGQERVLSDVEIDEIKKRIERAAKDCKPIKGKIAKEYGISRDTLWRALKSDGESE